VDELQVRKGHALSALSEPGFWERDDRFALLAEIEYLDRLASATRTAERLAARLERSVRPDGRANYELARLVSGRLYVLDSAVAGIKAGAPTEVVVHVRPAVTEPSDEAAAFAELVAEMYVAWAHARGMSIERLDAVAGEHLLGVGGLGCGEILGGESGLHVLEQVDEHRDGGKVVDREQVRVLVVPRPSAAAGSPVLVPAATTEADLPTIVRRYRPGRSSLVRDSVRGYRTGRLDRVLAGDFDLF
jgi:ATP-dependent Clp protease ATP-binding subunit ClpC